MFARSFKLAALLLLVSALPAGATTYCVSNSGNDANTGTASGPNCTGAVSAWATMAKVSAYSANPGFRPGDMILLQAGGVWRESLIFGSTATGSGPFPSSGASGAPITIASYGAGAPPMLDEADPLTGAWTLVTGATYKIAYTGYPHKLFVDSPTTVGTAAFPAYNYRGSFSTTATYAPFDAVVDNGNYYATFASQAASSTFNSSGTWFGTPWAIPTNYQNSGLTNVENDPYGVNIFWCDGSYLYLHLADGSNPANHTIDVATRDYGVELEDVNYVTVSGLTVIHANKVGILDNGYAAAGTQGNNVTITGNTILNTEDGSRGFIAQENYTGGGAISYMGAIVALPTNAGANLTGVTIANNTIDTIDDPSWRFNDYYAAIVAASVSGGTIAGNSIHPVNAEGMYLKYLQGSYPCKNLNVQNNTIWNATNGIRYNCQTSTVEHTLIHDSEGYGIQLQGGSGLIAYNTIYKNVPLWHDTTPFSHITGGSQAVDYNGFDCNGGVSGIQIYNNTVYNVGASDFTVEGTASGASCPNADVENNIFDGSQNYTSSSTTMHGGLVMYASSYSIMSAYKYNLSRVPQDTGGAEFQERVYTTSPASMITDNFAQWLAYMGGATQDSQTISIANAGNVEGNPLFTNPAGGDFSLQNGSPACGAGTPLAALGQTAAPNMGAWQGACSPSRAPEDTAGMALPQPYFLYAADWTQPGGTSDCPTCTQPAPVITRTVSGVRIADIETARGVFSSTFGNLWAAAPNGWVPQAQKYGAQLLYTWYDSPNWWSSASATGTGAYYNAPYDLNTANEACWMTTSGVVGTSVPSSNGYVSATGDCIVIEYWHKFMQKNCGVSAIPTAPLSGTCAIRFLEGWNEFNASTWTDTGANLAKMWVDASLVIRQYCADCEFLAGSATAGGDGYAPNLGFSAQYQTALATILADAYAYATNAKCTPGASGCSSFGALGLAYWAPDGVSYHPYPARTTANPVPFPESMVQGTGTTCTASNTPNVNCRNAVKDMPSVLRAALNTLPYLSANLPLWNTESGWNTNENLLLDTASQTINGTTYTVAGPQTMAARQAYTARQMLLLANPYNNAGTVFNLWYQNDDQCWGTQIGFLTGKNASSCPSYEVNAPGLAPAGIAWNAVYSWLHGAAFTGPCAVQTGDVWGCPIARAGGYTALVVWNTNWQATESYAVPSSFGQYRTIANSATPSAIDGGTVTVTNLPILLEGVTSFGHGRGNAGRTRYAR